MDPSFDDLMAPQAEEFGRMLRALIAQADSVASRAAACGPPEHDGGAAAPLWCRFVDDSVARLFEQIAAASSGNARLFAEMAELAPYLHDPALRSQARCGLWKLSRRLQDTVEGMLDAVDRFTRQSAEISYALATRAAIPQSRGMRRVQGHLIRLDDIWQRIERGSEWIHDTCSGQGAEPAELSEHLVLAFRFWWHQAVQVRRDYREFMARDPRAVLAGAIS